MNHAMLMVWLLSTTAVSSEGERLAYVLGCIACHHQTPREVMKSPSLVGVRRYSLEQFTQLLREGVTRTGRDLAADERIMGVAARERYRHLTDAEIQALHTFLSEQWTRERASAEAARLKAPDS